MVAHERPTEQRATKEWLLAKPRSFPILHALINYFKSSIIYKNIKIFKTIKVFYIWRCYWHIKYTVNEIQYINLRRCQSRPLKTDFKFMSDRLEVKMSNRVKVTKPITQNFANNQFRHGPCHMGKTSPLRRLINESFRFLNLRKAFEHSVRLLIMSGLVKNDYLWLFSRFSLNHPALVLPLNTLLWKYMEKFII